MEKSQQLYKKLHQLSRETKIIQGVAMVMEWDQETYMPPGAAGIRAEQLESLASLIHKKKTAPAFRKTLDQLIDLRSGKIKGSKLGQRQQAALRAWRRDILKATRLPNAFVKALAKLSSEAMTVWKQAKINSDFKTFQPYLERLVAMCRKKADLLGYKGHPYDALLDEYEPEATYQELFQLFGQIRKPIISLLKKVRSAMTIETRCLEGEFPVEKQLAFSHILLKAVGYDEKYGRLDFSSHPFSSSCHPTDSRITTRVTTPDIDSNILTVLHEAGHSLYEMGLPPEEYGSPLGEAISLGMHESQSRWWETRIGQGRPFWQYFFPKLKEVFPGKFDQVSLDAFVRAINCVTASMIRVEADEVTYPLHVMLRFDLEYELMDGSLKVKDLPEAWNGKMKDYLGVVPTNDREGCLQDVHWSMGAFGYFPTYALGNIYAAHLFETFEEQHPDWPQRVAKGELLFIREWLRQNVYQYGREYSSQALLEKVTGKPLTAHAYLHYLQEKYNKLYKL